VCKNLRISGNLLLCFALRLQRANAHSLERALTRFGNSWPCCKQTIWQHWCFEYLRTFASDLLRFLHCRGLQVRRIRIRQ